MIDERMYGLGNAPSAIRELFAYGLKRKAEIGEDKVFDYSIGNPSVPAPQKVADTIEELMKLPPVELHAYSPAAGIHRHQPGRRHQRRRRGHRPQPVLPRV